MWASGTTGLDRKKALFKGKTTGLGFDGLLHPQLWNLEGHNPSPAPTARERFWVWCDPKSTTQKQGRGRGGEGRLRLAEHKAPATADVPASWKVVYLLACDHSSFELIALAASCEEEKLHLAPGQAGDPRGCS